MWKNRSQHRTANYGCPDTIHFPPLSRRDGVRRQRICQLQRSDVVSDRTILTILGADVQRRRSRGDCGSREEGLDEFLQPRQREARGRRSLVFCRRSRGRSAARPGAAAAAAASTANVAHASEARVSNPQWPRPRTLRRALSLPTRDAAYASPPSRRRPRSLPAFPNHVRGTPILAPRKHSEAHFPEPKKIRTRGSDLWNLGNVVRGSAQIRAL